MQFGLNNVNNEKKMFIKHSMSPSKVQLPHQIAPSPTPAATHEKKFNDANPTSTPSQFNIASSSKKHDANLAMVTIVVAGLAWYMFR